MTRNNSPIKTPSKKLTRRENEVLTLLASGKKRSEIPRVLSIDEETVKDHIMRACRKLQAVNKTHAVALATWLELITPFGRRNPKDEAK